MELVGAKGALNHLQESFPPDGTGRGKIKFESRAFGCLSLPGETRLWLQSSLANKPQWACAMKGSTFIFERRHLMAWYGGTWELITLVLCGMTCMPKRPHAVSIDVPALGTMTASAPLSHSFSLSHRPPQKPWGSFQSSLCKEKKRENKKFKGNTTLTDRMFTCYL